MQSGFAVSWKITEYTLQSITTSKKLFHFSLCMVALMWSGTVASWKNHENWRCDENDKNTCRTCRVSTLYGSLDSERPAVSSEINEFDASATNSKIKFTNFDFDCLETGRHEIQVYNWHSTDGWALTAVVLLSWAEFRKLSGRAEVATGRWEIQLFRWRSISLRFVSELCMNLKLSAVGDWRVELLSWILNLETERPKLELRISVFFADDAIRNVQLLFWFLQKSLKLPK